MNLVYNKDKYADPICLNSRRLGRKFKLSISIIILVDFYCKLK